jgi:hypothetical protein
MGLLADIRVTYKGDSGALPGKSENETDRVENDAA